MPASSATPVETRRGPVESLRTGFAALSGLFLGLSLLKFGNPAILDPLVARPFGFWEWMLQPWPLAWGYALLAGLALLGFAVAEWRLPRPRVWVWLPLVWLLWQAASATDTVDARLTRLTLPYLASVVAGFYLGMLTLARAPQLRVFWLALAGCFAAVLVSGFQQQLGGLEATRQFVLSQPGAETLPPEYLKRLEGGRIFATLVYPNALAGVIVLLLPPLVVALWLLLEGRGVALRFLLPAGLALAGLACLYWSRSKAGWLLALGLALVAGGRLPLVRQIKIAFLAVAVLGGLTVFAVRFADYFQAGAASAGARLQYWKAAWATARAHPWLGSGPGTFAPRYRAIKPPEAEMALLAHNDYLQQASDSGFPGALAYAGFWLGTLGVLGRRLGPNPLRFAVWLGLLGWALQGLVEFALYVPAGAWTAFWLAGWLWGGLAAAGPRSGTASAG